jgi:hypothetical protein
MELESAARQGRGGCISRGAHRMHTLYPHNRDLHAVEQTLGRVENANAAFVCSRAQPRLQAPSVDPEDPAERMLDRVAGPGHRDASGDGVGSHKHPRPCSCRSSSQGGAAKAVLRHPRTAAASRQTINPKRRCLTTACPLTAPARHDNIRPPDSTRRPADPSNRSTQTAIIHDILSSNPRGYAELSVWMLMRARHS